MLFELRSLVGGVILPAGVAFSVLFLLLRARQDAADRTIRMTSGLGVGLGFAAGYAALGWAPLVPTKPWNWLPYLVLLATVYTEYWLDGPWLPLWVSRLSIAILAGAILVPSWVVQEHAIVWPFRLAVTICTLWTALSREAVGAPNALAALLLALNLGCGAVVLMLSGNAKFAQLAIGGAAALGGAWVAGLAHRSSAAAAGARPLVAVLLPGIMAEGWFGTFSAIPWYSFVLVVAAPVIWAGACALPKKTNSVSRLYLEIVALLLPCIVAVGLALAVDAGE